ATGRRPWIVMSHGFTDDKTGWEETGKSDTVLSKDRPQQNSRWNNVWFVSRGYVVVNYTARGWHDSCGPDTPGATRVAPAPQCAPFQYWIHLDDKRWEVRDAQWLAGALVQSGIADAHRLAITGGSYGWAGAPPDANHTDPFGIPIESTVAGLLAAGETSGFFAPPGRDPNADIVADAGRLLAGNPFPQEDPLVARGVRVYRDFKSP